MELEHRDSVTWLDLPFALLQMTWVWQRHNLESRPFIQGSCKPRTESLAVDRRMWCFRKQRKYIEHDFTQHYVLAGLLRKSCLLYGSIKHQIWVWVWVWVRNVLHRLIYFILSLVGGAVWGDYKTYKSVFKGAAFLEEVCHWGVTVLFLYLLCVDENTTSQTISATACHDLPPLMLPPLWK